MLVRWLIAVSAAVAVGAAGIVTALVRQALWLRRTIPRLPRPSETTHGFIVRIADKASPLRCYIAHYRLLVIGDSMVRGVGCQYVHQTFGYQLALQLAQRLSEEGQSCIVEWHLLGRTGYTVRAVHQRLVPQISIGLLQQQQSREPIGEPTAKQELSSDALAELSAALQVVGLDVDDCNVLPNRTLCVASCSANDLVHLHSTRRLRHDLLLLFAAVREKLGEDTPYFQVGMPPIHTFPLPWPLRTLLYRGLRAYDAVHREMHHSVKGFYHLGVLERFSIGTLLGTDEGTRAIRAAVERFYQGGERPSAAASPFCPLPAVYPRSIPVTIADLAKDLVAEDHFHLNYHGSAMLAALSVPQLVSWIRTTEQSTMSNDHTEQGPDSSLMQRVYKAARL